MLSQRCNIETTAPDISVKPLLIHGRFKLIENLLSNAKSFRLFSQECNRRENYLDRDSRCLPTERRKKKKTVARS